MIFEEELYFWSKLGSCRQAELARQLGVTRQYINNAITTDITLSQEQQDRFKRAMNRVELREAKFKRSVESNILKCAKNIHSEVAKAKLEYWVNVYSKGNFIA